MPKVIYMIHALSIFLVKLGLAPRLQKKKYKFTGAPSIPFLHFSFFLSHLLLLLLLLLSLQIEEELALASEKLGDIALPNFGGLGAALGDETSAQNEYEAKAGPFSSWLEEKIAYLDNREFNYAGVEQINELLQELEAFSQTEKPPKEKELEELAQSYTKINDSLAAAGKEAFSPPEFMKVEKLNEEWAHLGTSEKHREDALRLRLELAELQAKSDPVKAWVREQAVTFSKRNYEEAKTEELAQLVSNIEEFRAGEKTTK